MLLCLQPPKITNILRIDCITKNTSALNLYEEKNENTGETLWIYLTSLDCLDNCKILDTDNSGSGIEESESSDQIEDKANDLDQLELDLMQDQPDSLCLGSESCSTSDSEISEEDFDFFKNWDLE